MAAIRSCGGAFVANAPRRSFSTGIRSTLSNNRRGAIQSNHFSVSRIDPPISHGEISPRAASSSVLTSATAPLQPLVVCGPSGVGKGTIISRYMERRNSAESSRPSGLPNFGFSVSHTTRQPRPGEVNGEHYHFVTHEFMYDKIESGSFFIEHAEVHGNLYGTSFQSISDVSSVVANDSEIMKISIVEQQCLLDIDVEGVRSIKMFQSEQSTQQYLTSKSDSMPELDAKFIFIAPPSVDALRERLVGRGTETSETLERRFQNAKAELEYGMEPGNFDAIVVNDDLDKAIQEFEKIIEDMYVG